MAKAIKSAAAISIVGKGTRKSDSAPVYAATSSSEPGRFHLIVWEHTRDEWVCDCAAWRWRHTCRHITAVNERVASERVGFITPAGYAALDEWHRRKAQERETSPRRVQSFPASLLK